MSTDEDFFNEMHKIDAQIAQVEARYEWAGRNIESALTLVGLPDYSINDPLTDNIVNMCVDGALTEEGKADMQKAAQYALMAAYRLMKGAMRTLQVLKSPDFKEGDDAFSV